MIKGCMTAAIVCLLMMSGAFGNAYAMDPMRLGIRTNLPKQFNTIGQAAKYYADAIGYKLVTAYPAPEESAAIADERINPLARSGGVKPIEEAILSLLRQGCNLVIDHEHKLFSFEHGRGME